MKNLLAALLCFAVLLFGATVINGDRTMTGRWDASGATATLPFQSGTTAALPATCSVGQVYFATDGIPGRKIQTCTATNTWSLIAYAQGTTSALPATCSTGQVYFATDALAGQNLYFCTAGNTWNQMVGGSGVTMPTFTMPWNWATGGSSASFSSNNQVRYYYVLVPNNTAFSKITARVTLASSGKFYAVAIYTSLAAKVAGSEVTIDAGTTGARSGTTSGSATVTLAAGAYFVVVGSQAGGSIGLASSNVNSTLLEMMNLNTGTAGRYGTCAESADFVQSLGSILPATCTGTASSATAQWPNLRLE